MNRYNSNFLSLGRCARILGGLLLVVLGSLYFFTVSAKTDAGETPPDQNLLLGRIVYSTLVGTFSGPQLAINTANADGTGAVGVTNFPPASEPSWAPDGRIVFVREGEGSDVFVMDADGNNQINLSNTMGVNEANPSWSVSGKIAYERGGQIWMMNADGSNQIQFPGITQASPSDPIWSADGSRLAFVSDGEIWKINADGSNEMRVTTNASTDADPAWSPDGARIVFSKGGSGIAVVNANGTNEINLTTVPGDVNPSWSPDGTTIAFRRAAAPSGIYVMDVTGANQVRIIADTQTTASIFSRHDNPSWQPVAQPPNTFTISGRITRTGVSLAGATVNLGGTTNAVATTDAAGNYQFSGLQPGGSYTVSPSMLNHYFTPPHRTFSNIDGNRIADFTGFGVCSGSICAVNGQIAFVRDPGEIFTMNSDGTNQTNITNSAAIDTDPNYSPDGLKMAFSTNRDGNYEIYRMDADGANPVRLTNNSASETEPYYSPDGASIVFISNRDGNNEIYKMNADGTNQVRLTNDTLYQNVPAFSPDGQKIIFVAGPSAASAPNQLWVMNADGTNQQQFTNPPGASHYYNHPSYSPNGQGIIFTYGSDITTQQTWTMNADGTNRVQIPNAGRKPTYSPDGTKVVGSNPFVPAQGIYANSVRLTTQFDTLPDWQPIAVPRRTAFDFDGDARSDPSFFRPVGGFWYLLRSTDGLWTPQWGLSTDILAPADYDGDLKTDLAVWRESDRNFYVLNSFNATVRIENFGLAGDIPTGGDFDGDGKADVAVYRPGAQGTFYYRASMGNPQSNVTFLPWGVSGDKPVAGDYDGDGRTDAAVYRPSNGTWYVRKSSDAQLFAVNFGLASDTLVPADYDADGKTDLAVFRSGIWYLLRSTLGFTAFQFGLAKDIPAPADYDGDGRADAAVFRNGVWWMMRSQSGSVEAVTFGTGGDKPIPSAFVR